MTTPILRVTARWLTPVIGVLSVYLVLRGEHAPGGGFIGAAVAGLAIVFRFFALGPEPARRILPLGTGGLVGTGLLLIIATGAGGWLWGDHFLEVGSLHLAVPAIGEIQLSTALLFEAGIFVAVVAIVAAVVEELGREA